MRDNIQRILPRHGKFANNWQKLKDGAGRIHRQIAQSRRDTLDSISDMTEAQKSGPHQPG